MNHETYSSIKPPDILRIIKTCNQEGLPLETILTDLQVRNINLDVVIYNLIVLKYSVKKCVLFETEYSRTSILNVTTDPIPPNLYDLRIKQINELAELLRNDEISEGNLSQEIINLSSIKSIKSLPRIVIHWEDIIKTNPLHQVFS
jgi:hypothetical protein